MKDFLTIDREHIMQLYPNRGITLVWGKGVYLFDAEGKRYLDVMSNYGVNILGHNNPFVTKRLREQLARLVDLHGSFVNDQRSLAAERLVSLCPKNLTNVYFGNSGAEAIEAALKFARLASGKLKFIAMHHGYHGKTLGALSATADKKYREPFLPLLWDFAHVDFGDIDKLKAALDAGTAAVIIEPIQGEGGIQLPPIGYLKKVQTLCNSRNVLLIIDEIQTGGGRTGRFLAIEEDGIKPDILVLGKGLAGGLPVGITIVTRDVASKVPRGSHTSTFGGNPLVCAGILATLEYLTRHSIFPHVQDVGAYFFAQLKAVRSEHIKEVRGKGLMIGVELDIPNTPILKSMQEKGVLAIPSGHTVVRMLPPLIITRKQIDEAVRVFRSALD